jgi:hypothetical protein
MKISFIHFIHYNIRKHGLRNFVKRETVYIKRKLSQRTLYDIK